MTKKSEQKNSSTKKGIETVQSRLNSSEEKSEEKKSKWDDFLHPHKIIRDAVHGDIEITKLETKLIDTEIFQRLHGIKQLGPTYLVYPDAKHTRFEHSLGVLYVAQKIIN
ncbi:MAG: hypothetical protein KAU14_02400, partial [Thermoplasmata archaeon]|nr:hypothetical protein [Thermoplasmata archaeon]